MKPSSVVGELGWNGGLWCSPRAKTSSPISSAFFAMATAALMRSCSVGSAPGGGIGRDVADAEDAQLHDCSK